MNEFELISKFFAKGPVSRDDVIIPSGDDCAVLAPPPGHTLATTIDALVAGVHFLPDADPEALGHNALAVSLSDLAAMGATPAWAMVALTISEVDEAWLSAFARGFFALAAEHNVQLVGGDLTQGPLSMASHVTGFLPQGKQLTRAGAQPGDLIYVGGPLGEGALAVQQSRCHRPHPQVALGQRLCGVATAAIDVSDGLVADLKHILCASQVGATLNVDQVPIPSALRDAVPADEALTMALSGGEDYVLCFTLPPAAENAELTAGCTCIGEIEGTSGLRILHDDGTPMLIKHEGYQHF